jgi:hypothetical protein
MLPEASPTDPFPRCAVCHGAMTREGEALMCPQCAVGSLLAMDPLTGEETPPPPAPSAEVFDDVVPGVDLLMIKGSGGMGTVLKGRQLSLDRDVAVKIIRRDRAEDPAYEAALREEAGSMARLDHPGIVRVLDFGRTLGGSLYLLLEWVEGTTLRHLLDRRGALSAEEAAGLIMPLCAALQHAHDHCVVHRDLKPENILLTTEGQPKLADFGLARLGGRAAGFAVPGSKSNRPASTVGTPAYMAPEQAGGAAVVDRRADLYALALILQEMLTGHRPAERPVTGTVADALPPVPALRHLPASTPAGIRELLRHNLSSVVEERAESARTFADDLRRALGPPDAGPPAGLEARRGGRWSRRAWTTSVGTLGLGTAAGTAWLKWGGGMPAAARGADSRPDPLREPAITSALDAAERAVVARRSPPVDLVPGLALGPMLPLRPPLSAEAAAEMDQPLESGLSAGALELRLVRFAEAHLRCYDTDSPRAPELADDGQLETANDESGFLNIGRLVAGQFKQKWSAYVKDYPHLYTMLLGAPVVRPLESGRHEATAVIWSRFGTGHRFGKLETSLRLEIEALENQRLLVKRIRKAESSLVPPNAAEARMVILKMAQLILETLARENSAFLPAFFEPRHHFCGRPRPREEVEKLVANRSPQLERNRLRLLNGPEVIRHDSWLHTGVFLAEARKDLPEAELKVGEACLVLLTMHFERVWPLIRSLDIRPLRLLPSLAGPAALVQPPPPSK